MNKEKCLSLLADIESLVLFAGIKEKPALKSLASLLRFVLAPQLEAPPHAFPARTCGLFFDSWPAFVRALLPAPSFSSLIAEYAADDENPFTLGAERRELSPRLIAMAQSDFSRLVRIASLDISRLALTIKERLEAEGLYEEAECVLSDAASLSVPLESAETRGGSLPLIPRNEDQPAVKECAKNFAAWIKCNGAGMFCRFRSFSWVSSSGNLILKPASDPDPVMFSDFSGFEAQHSVVKNNTLRFVEGKPANNLLLYGDRGTGKSAAVKAAANEYAHMGLRLVEIRKELLSTLPDLMENLSGRGLKFILFIDDLSFETMDDSFTGLKALLEGGVERLPSNMVVYATSNRRHFVKEASNEKLPGGVMSGALRDFDTLQEQLSLADRFGLTVVYTSPDQEEYLSIAEFIARRRGLLKDNAEGHSPQDEKELIIFRENALRWERWFNGRSPRTALQYVDWLEGGEGFPWE